MNAFSPLTRLALLGLALAATGTAAAAGEITPYVGVGAGVAHYGYDSEMCSQDLAGPCEVDQNDTGMKIFGGVRLAASQSLIEVAYYDFGSLTGTANSSLIGQSELEEEQTAVAISMAMAPTLAADLEGLLRFGLYSADVEARIDSTMGSGAVSDSTSGLMLGAGAMIHIGEQAGLRLEYEHFVDAGDSETDLGIATASLVLSF